MGGTITRHSFTETDRMIEFDPNADETDLENENIPQHFTLH